jgi:hypothetical protein
MENSQVGELESTPSPAPNPIVTRNFSEDSLDKSNARAEEWATVQATANASSAADILTTTHPSSTPIIPFPEIESIGRSQTLPHDVAGLPSSGEVVAAPIQLTPSPMPDSAERVMMEEESWAGPTAILQPSYKAALAGGNITGDNGGGSVQLTVSFALATVPTTAAAAIQACAVNTHTANNVHIEATLPTHRDYSGGTCGIGQISGTAPVSFALATIAAASAQPPAAGCVDWGKTPHRGAGAARPPGDCGDCVGCDFAHLWPASAPAAGQAADEGFPVWGIATDAEVIRILDGQESQDDQDSEDSCDSESREAQYWRWVFTQPFALDC